MESTRGWILFVLLVNGAHVDLGPQPDCTAAGAAWIREARHWAQRSGVPITEPFYSCTPPDIAYRIERVSR